MVRLAKLVDLTPWNRFTYRLWFSDREGRQTMPQKRDRPEEIIAKLSEAQALLAQGQEGAQAVKALGVSEVTYLSPSNPGQQWLLTARALVDIASGRVEVGRPLAVASPGPGQPSINAVAAGWPREQAERVRTQRLSSACDAGPQREHMLCLC